jgi:transposase InsO family protein
MKYAKYDQKIIYLVSKTRNPNLFPELKIPKSSAKYWIRNKQHLKLKPQKNAESLDTMALKSKINCLKKEKRKQMNELRTLKAYISILTKKKLIKCPSELTRFQIIQTIRNNRGDNSIRKVLNSLQVSFSTYKRWAKIRPAIQNSKSYIQSTSRSLTEKEVKKLKDLYLDRSLFFYPLHALSTKAKRDRLLYISPRTWQKYVQNLKLHRPILLKRLKKEYPIGIRANYPHEIWHIDVTEFRINKKRIFMQTIIDNYSRSVITFQVTKNISGSNTVNLINMAFRKFGPPIQLMSDAGKENLNFEVKNCLIDLNVKHAISKLNTRFSNSMIEVFFRTLKINFLNHLLIKNERDLSQKIQFYIKNYNSEIPHSALNFRTPDEVLREVSSEYYPAVFKKLQKEALSKRMREYRKK